MRQIRDLLARGVGLSRHSATSRVLGTDPPAATVLPYVFSDRMALSWRISHGDLCGNLVQDEMREAYPRCAGSLPRITVHWSPTHPTLLHLGMLGQDHRVGISPTLLCARQLKKNGRMSPEVLCRCECL